MKVLVDENLPHALRTELPGHDVFTVQYMTWSCLKNGSLLTQAASAGFDVMVTMDNGAAYQQNISDLPLAIVVIRAISNDINDLRPSIPKLLNALASLKPKTLKWVD